MALRFERDRRKARSNFSKHGVSFEEAATAFGDLVSVTIADPDHSVGEQRFVTIDTAFTGRLLVVVHTERGDNISPDQSTTRQLTRATIL